MQTFSDWCEANQIEIRSNRASPIRMLSSSDSTESIEEVLVAYLFEFVEDVQSNSDDWLQDYNEIRPHDSLGGVPPSGFLKPPSTSEKSSLAMCP